MFNSNKSKQAKQKSAERLAKQQQRGSKKFTGKSNVHNGGSRGQSGSQSKR